MKSKSKWLWLIAIIATIGIIAVSCDNGNNNNNNTTVDPCADGHDWLYDPDAIAPTCTETGLGHRHCQRCDADEPGATPYPALGHTWSSWSMKTAADCITSEIEEGTCTVCGEEDTRYSPTNHALGHTINPVTKVSVSFGVFEGECVRCEDPMAHEFTYVIGDEGPAGGIIFYVADGEDGRPDGIAIPGYGSSGDNGYFATYTAYYLEAAPGNETSSLWGAAGTSIAGVTTSGTAGNPSNAIGNGRKDTQTIVNSTAFAALTDTAAQRCASKTLNGFTDWFLPSSGELNELYKAREQAGLSTAVQVWSSTQFNASSAWCHIFINGNRVGISKSSTNNPVRAIRAF